MVKRNLSDPRRDSSLAPIQRPQQRVPTLSFRRRPWLAKRPPRLPSSGLSNGVPTAAFLAAVSSGSILPGDPYPTGPRDAALPPLHAVLLPQSPSRAKSPVYPCCSAPRDASDTHGSRILTPKAALRRHGRFCACKAMRVGHVAKVVPLGLCSARIGSRDLTGLHLWLKNCRNM